MPSKRGIEYIEHGPPVVPSEMVDDTENRLAELEALIPWMKSYAEGLGDKIKELERNTNLSRLESLSAISDAILNDGMKSPRLSGDANLDGGDSATAWAFGCTLDGTDVHVEEGRVVAQGDSVYTIEAADYAVPQEDYAYPTVIFDIETKGASISVLTAFPTMSGNKIYFPLVRIKDGAFDAEDGAYGKDGYILHRGNVHIFTAYLTK